MTVLSSRADPEERKIKISSAAPVDLEAMPFPIDGRATEFEDMLRRRRSSGSLTMMCRVSTMYAPRTLVAEAYKELMERQDLKEEYGRVAAIAQRWGY